MQIQIKENKQTVIIGKTSVELSLSEIKELRDKLNDLLGDVVIRWPITYPPSGPLRDVNPEKPWQPDPEFQPTVWCRTEPSNIKVEI